MSNVNVNVKVSIPINVGGYTGQRDAWEQRETPYDVTLHADRVVLQENSGTVLRQIAFERADLESALRFLEERVG